MEIFPHEIHVSVRGSSLADFRADCAALGVKPLVLDLQDREGLSVMTDVMTSSKMRGTTEEALLTARRLSDDLSERGHAVVRMKVETVPWHPMTPRRGDGRAMPTDCYFESHIAVRTTAERLDALSEAARLSGCHRSRNPLKEDASGLTVMLTLRLTSGCLEEFRDRVDALSAILTEFGFEVLKTEVEFAVRDSRIGHDRAWIEGVSA